MRVHLQAQVCKRSLAHPYIQTSQFRFSDLYFFRCLCSSQFIRAKRGNSFQHLLVMSGKEVLPLMLRVDHTNGCSVENDRHRKFRETLIIINNISVFFRRVFDQESFPGFRNCSSYSLTYGDYNWIDYNKWRFTF